MKSAIITILCFISTISHAGISDITVMCKRTSNSGCSGRTLDAFKKVGCNPVSQSVECHDAAADPLLDPAEINNVRGKDFCVIQSNCQVPNYGNFGQVSCNGEAVDLKSVDAGITLTTSVGFPSHYVTELCK